MEKRYAGQLWIEQPTQIQYWIQQISPVAEDAQNPNLPGLEFLIGVMIRRRFMKRSQNVRQTLQVIFALMTSHYPATPN